MVSKCRQNYHEDAEAAVNKQVVTHFFFYHTSSRRCQVLRVNLCNLSNDVDQYGAYSLLSVLGLGEFYAVCGVLTFYLANFANGYLQAAYFDRDDVALKGFAKFYKDSAEEENEHAQKFIKYQNLRGGRVVFSGLNRPAVQEWASPLASIEFALALEKQVSSSFSFTLGLKKSTVCISSEDIHVIIKKSCSAAIN